MHRATNFTSGTITQSKNTEHPGLPNVLGSVPSQASMTVIIVLCSLVLLMEPRWLGAQYVFQAEATILPHFPSAKMTGIDHHSLGSHHHNVNHHRFNAVFVNVRWIEPHDGAAFLGSTLCWRDSHCCHRKLWLVPLSMLFHCVEKNLPFPAHGLGKCFSQ